MKRLKHRLSKGFTLIELMVVISIISLLSSIVLASVKEVREKAQITKIRSEMNQLINALELYKADKGEYPYENTAGFMNGNSYTSGIYINNSDYNESDTGAPNLRTLLTGYVSNLPKNPVFSNNITQTSWVYRSNFGVNKYRCVNDSVIPKYIISITNVTNNSFMVNAFLDWPKSQVFIVSNQSWFDSSNYCFSLK